MLSWCPLALKKKSRPIISRLSSPGLTWTRLFYLCASRENYDQKGNDNYFWVICFLPYLATEFPNLGFYVLYFGVGGIMEMLDDFVGEIETVEWGNLVVNKGVCGLVGRGGGRQTSAILTSFPNSRIDSRSRNCLHSWIPLPPLPSPTTLSKDSWLDCGLGRVGLSLARIPKS